MKSAKDKAPSVWNDKAVSAIGLVVIVGLFFALAAAFVPYTADDAYITFRYSRQWALGVGPYFNPGEHVEGYSNFLLMLLLTPIIRLGGPEAALRAAKTIGLLSAAAALAGTFFMGRLLALASKNTQSRANLAGLVSAGMVACTPAFAVNAVSGLETMLYAACVTWGACGMASGSLGGLRLGSLALSAAAITRPEAPLIFAICCTLTAARAKALPERLPNPLGRGGESRGPSLRDLLVASSIGITIIGAHVIFRHLSYDGEWLPNTYYAKTSGWGDSAVYVREALTASLLGVVGLAAAVVGWLIERRSAGVCLVAAGVGLSGSLLPLFMGADWMIGYRLVVPYLPLLAAAVSVGWLRFAMRALRARPALGAILLLAMVPSSYFWQLRLRDSYVHIAALTAKGALTGHTALAEWLRKDARAGDSVVLMDIGLIGFRCIEQTVIDLTGLTDRYIAKSPGAFLRKQYNPEYIFAKRPRYIVLVFTAPGDPYAPLPPGASLDYASEMEGRLAAHPDFRRYYVDSLRSPEPTQNGFETVAAAIGAQKMFPYALPDEHYLLAVYRRHD